jgi:predicted ABC-type ATPase
MPTILIIAGPNGAGKTTFANAWFADQGVQWPYLNADDIGRDELPGLGGAGRDIAAGRLLLTRIDELVAARRDFALETTLSSGLYARRIPGWRERGYAVELAYIRLVSADLSLARVAHRVAQGGHGVPEADVRRRFSRSLWNLEQRYKPLVDRWRVWESRDGGAILIDRSTP